MNKTVKENHDLSNATNDTIPACHFQTKTHKITSQ